MKKIITLSLSIIVALSIFPSGLNAEKNTAGNTSIIIDNPVMNIRLNKKEKGIAKMKIIDVKGQPFSKAVRVSVIKETAKDWDVTLSLPNVEKIFKGDNINIVFYTRFLPSELSKDRGKLAFRIQPRGEGSIVYKVINAKTEWTKNEFSVVSPKDILQRKASIFFSFGFGIQTIDIGGIKVYKDTGKLAFKD